MKIRSVIGLIVVFAIGAGAGIGVSRYPQMLSVIGVWDTVAPEVAPETALEHAAKHLDPSYVCPMHPQIVRDEPGSCPICGMDLVAVEAEQPVAEGDKKILYWVAPMDPNYRRDGPGKSPMGMDLIPVYDEGGGAAV